MNKKTVTISAALSGLMILTSCVKEVINEMPVEPTSHLKVITRASDDDQLTIAMPLHVYVFGSDGRCAARQTIDGDDALVPISLAEGTYDVYALGGVDDDRYVLPSQEDARQNTEICLREGKALDDLMTASAHVSLVDGEEKQLTLAMERKVVLLRGITIRNVPEDVTAVSVTIQPLNESILLNGTLTGTDGEHTVTLVEQNNGSTWKTASDAYLFPPAQKPTISVSFERENGTKSYAYTCKENLAANYKLSIEGVYHAEQGVTISGIATGTEWDGEKTINLTFDERTGNVTGEEDNENNEDNGNTGNTSTSTLKVGDTYKDCYVLAVDGKNVTLLSSKERDKITASNDNSETALSKINAALTSWNEEGISATWVVPDETTMSQYLLNNNTNKNYFCIRSNNTLGSINVYGGKTNTRDNIGSGNFLRPVTTITIE